MDNKLETVLKENKTNKSTSTITNPRSETVETQKKQPSGSKTEESIGVHALNVEN